MLCRQLNWSLRPIEAGEQLGEIGSGEAPLERFGDALVVVLEPEQALLDLLKGAKVIGCERFTLDDREIDFDLIEPAGMNGAVYGHEIGIGCLETAHAGRTAVRRTVIQNPEDTAGIPVRWLAHHLSDEAAERLDARGVFTATEELSVMHVECREVSPSAAAAVLMFDAGGLTRTCRGTGVLAKPRLNAGFLIGADHELIGSQSLALPLSGVQVENAASLEGKLRISREDPAPMLPRADRILIEPAPHRRAADGGDQSRALCCARNVGAAQSRQRHLTIRRRFTGDGFDAHDHVWGKKPGAARAVHVPPGPVSVHGKTACATG